MLCCSKVLRLIGWVSVLQAGRQAGKQQQVCVDLCIVFICLLVFIVHSISVIVVLECVCVPCVVYCGVSE